MVLNFYNNYHLGDCLFSVMFLNKLIENTENLLIGFNCDQSYVPELKLHAHPNIRFVPDGTGTNLWIQADGVWGKYVGECNSFNCFSYYDDFYLRLNSGLCSKLGFDNYFNKLEDVLYSNSDLERRRYPDYDYLIVNSQGHSGQYPYVAREFSDFVNKLSGKIITTEKISGFECTRDRNMSLLDIANLSIGCNTIIGVHTAPFVTILNNKSINTVKNWVLLNDKKISYKIRNFTVYDNIRNVDIQKIL